MTQADKLRILYYCSQNLRVHSDWTGKRVETKEECDDVNKFADGLIAYLED